MSYKDKTPLLFAKKHILETSYSLQYLSENLDPSFSAFVDAISSLPQYHRVIYSGIGKAGFIAKKASATLASLGLRSFFVHPAEAGHGDLGRIAEGDLVIILSNSGETEEIIKLIPYLKKIGALIFSITQNKKSSLAKYSDSVITLGKIKESDSLPLAPTTSTTLMLVLTDALAMAVAKEKNIKLKDFAFYHPAGHIGKSLLKVKSIMRSGDMYCSVNQDTSIRETIHKITSTLGRPGAAVVVDKDGALLGIFTDGNLRRCLDLEHFSLDEPIYKYMTKAPKCISSEALVQKAMNLFAKYKIDQLVVIKEEKPVGILDVQDVVGKF